MFVPDNMILLFKNESITLKITQYYGLKVA